MALIPLFTHESLSGGTILKIVDTTVYGNGITNPNRAQSLVNFEVEYMRGTPIQLVMNGYVPETVTQILQPITNDGWYRIKMTITRNPVGTWATDFSEQKVIDVLIIDRLCACKANYLNKITDKPCGCEDSSVWKNIFCMEGQLQGVTRFVAKNDMKSADMVVERLLLECQHLNSDCGC